MESYNCPGYYYAKELQSKLDISNKKIEKLESFVEEIKEIRREWKKTFNDIYDINHRNNRNMQKIKDYLCIQDKKLSDYLDVQKECERNFDKKFSSLFSMIEKIEKINSNVLVETSAFDSSSNNVESNQIESESSFLAQRGNTEVEYN